MPKKMPRPRFVHAAGIPLAALGLVLAPGGAIAAHSAVAPQPRLELQGGKTAAVFSYADAIREHVYVESPIDSDGDGTLDRVRVDIIRPKESGQGLKVPVIMDESPYYDNAGRGNESEHKTYGPGGEPLKFPLFYDNYFVPRGYAFLAVDMIGTTRSDGCPTSGGAPDVLGGKAVVDWLNGRAKAFQEDGSQVRATWTTGKVGMIGKSYDGTLANGVAATGVDGLATIVPISAISSWYEYSRMNGVKYWSDEQPWLADFVDTDPPAKCAAVRQQLDQGEDDATGNYNAYWAGANYRNGTTGNLGNVKASVFAFHGVNDLNVKDDHFGKWWRGLAARGVPRKVWLSQRGHVDPFDTRREVWVDTLHRWFDYWLHGIDNGIMSEPRADVELGPDQWITQSDWPAPKAKQVRLRPHPDGSLRLNAAAAGSTAGYTDAPGGSGFGTTEDLMVADPTIGQPYRQAFATPALPFDVRLSGTPAVDLRLKLDKPTAGLTVLLVDYGTDTRVDHLGPGSGIKTLAEEDCHGESTAADDACYRTTQTTTTTAPLNIVSRGWMDAQNRASLSNPAPLTPGTYYRVRWQTLPHDYVFKKGHRLALVLAGTDQDYNEEQATGAKVTVDLAGSSVLLPLLPGGAPLKLSGPAAKNTWRGPTKVDQPVQPRRFF